MRRKYSIVLLSAVLCTVASCEFKSKTEILTSAQWVGWPLAEQLDADGDWAPKYETINSDCMADDYVSFNLDGTYAYHNGPNICDPNGTPIAGSGTWRFIDDEKKMLWNGDTMIVEALRTGKLQLSRIYDVEKNYGTRLTFKR